MTFGCLLYPKLKFAFIISKTKNPLVVSVNKKYDNNLNKMSTKSERKDMKNHAKKLVSGLKKEDIIELLIALDVPEKQRKLKKEEKDLLREYLVEVIVNEAYNGNTMSPMYGISVINSLSAIQREHVDKLVTAIEKYRIAFDGSDTGSGKTRCGVSAAAMLGYCVYIIGPKQSLIKWEEYCVDNNIDVLGYATPITIAQGKYIPPENFHTYCKSSRGSLISPYNIREEEHKTDKKGVSRKFLTFDWCNLPDNCLVIWDEAQSVKNPSTISAKAFYSLIDQIRFNGNGSLLILSGTLFAETKHMISYAYAAGLIDTPTKKPFNELLRRWKRKWINEGGNDKNVDYASFMNNRIYHEGTSPRGSRLTKKDIKKFLDREHIVSDIKAVALYSDNEEEIQKVNEEFMELVIAQQNKTEENSMILSRMVQLSKQRELLMIPVFIGMAEKAITKGKHVVIFMRFVDNMDVILTHFFKEYDPAIIYGKQTSRQKEDERLRFQSGESKIAIVNIESGSSAIDLDDEDGDKERFVICSATTWSAISLKQALGRVDRPFTTMSCSKQRIPFVKNTIEEQVITKLNEKLDVIDSYNGTELEDQFRLIGDEVYNTSKYSSGTRLRLRQYKNK